MMRPDHSDETREEVYLAAMLHNIGETAFWATGHKLTEGLLGEISLSHDEFDALCSNEISTSFQALSLALSQQWNKLRLVYCPLMAQPS